jgi:two-component system, chemotaxis family, response regulator PixH
MATILVVEDTLTESEIITGTLRKAGFTTELCRTLKENPETAGIPIILCSTKNGEMDKFWGMKQGASSYITKPIVGEELINAMQAILK